MNGSLRLLTLCCLLLGALACSTASSPVMREWEAAKWQPVRGRGGRRRSACADGRDGREGDGQPRFPWDGHLPKLVAAPYRGSSGRTASRDGSAGAALSRLHPRDPPAARQAHQTSPLSAGTPARGVVSGGGHRHPPIHPGRPRARPPEDSQREGHGAGRGVEQRMAAVRGGQSPAPIAGRHHAARGRTRLSFRAVRPGRALQHAHCPRNAWASDRSLMTAVLRRRSARA